MDMRQAVGAQSRAMGERRQTDVPGLCILWMRPKAQQGHLSKGELVLRGVPIAAC